MGRKPSVAAKQDELSPGTRLGELRLDRFAVLDREAADNFRNAAALTGPSQMKRSINR
jgi:hypothetical protein